MTALDLVMSALVLLLLVPLNIGLFMMYREEGQALASFIREKASVVNVAVYIGVTVVLSWAMYRYLRWSLFEVAFCNM